MINVTRLKLFPGVSLTTVKTSKFKSGAFGAQMLLPLKADTASLNALVPMVLRRGTAAHPDMESLSAALDELYGGSIEPVIRRKGETQCVGFVGSFLDDAYTLNKEPLVEHAAALLCELLLKPKQLEGGFDPDYVEQERTNLIDRIRGQMNDKRQYASIRVIEEMCADEPFGVDKLGSEACAAAITPPALWAHYQELLRTAPMEFYYCGSADAEHVRDVLVTALETLPKTQRDPVPAPPAIKAAPATPKCSEERLNVTQGKLSMGLRTGGINAWSADYPALLLCNALYGGTTTSKLFLNVREKLSLCYYASSQLEKFKGVMIVSSGVEFNKVEQAKAEILTQLERCQQGQFDEKELESARRSVVSSYRSILDSQGQLEDYWLGQAIAGLSEGPEELCAQLEAVTRDQVIAAARKLTLDTVYFLKSKEG